MSIFPRPLKKVLGKIIPFSLVDLIPTFNLGTGAASTATFLRGDQTWSTVPTISGGGGNNVNYYLNGGTASSVATYYQMSNTPVIGTGVDFNKSGNGLISQWLTDVGNPNVTEIPAGNWNFEMYFSASSSGGVPKFYIEILKYNGATFTTIANNSAVPESITNGTITDLYLTSVAVPFTSLLITDRLAVRVYIVDNTPGRTITQHTQDSHLCQIITSFSSGISSINALTKNTQYIVAGTAGTDFNVSSVTDTHTLNLPTASATKRGALNSVDWSTFNAKQNPITLTTTGTGAATFVADVLNIPTPSGGSGLTVGTTAITSGTIGRILFQNGSNVLAQDSALFWDNTNKRLGIETATPLAKLHVSSNGFGQDIFRVTYAAGSTDIINAKSGGYGTGTLTFAPTDGVVCNASLKMGFNSILGANSSYILLENGGGGNQSMYFKTITPSSVLGFQFLNASNTQLFQITSGGNVSIGATAPAARLDIRAQGALSTDIAFRVRNSADNDNLLEVGGSGIIKFKTGTERLEINTATADYKLSVYKYSTEMTRISTYLSYFCYGSSSQYLGIGTNAPTHLLDLSLGGTQNQIITRFGNNFNNTLQSDITLKFTTGYTGGSYGGNPLAYLTIGNNGGVGVNNNCKSYFKFLLNKGNTLAERASITSQSNLLLQAPTEDTNDIGVIYIPNGTAPTASIVDGFKQYSADIIAGNAAPHFRTENGNIIKLYQETTAVAASTFVVGIGTAVTDASTFDGYTLKQIVKALRNQGLLT